MLSSDADHDSPNRPAASAPGALPVLSTTLSRGVGAPSSGALWLWHVHCAGMSALGRLAAGDRLWIEARDATAAAGESPDRAGRHRAGFGHWHGGVRGLGRAAARGAGPGCAA